MGITDHGIHILPGDSAAGTWNMAFGAEERLLVHRDDLTCGPLCKFHSLSTWTALRQDFWNAVSPAWAEDSLHSYGDSAVSDLPRTWERLRDAPAIYLWAGNEFHDQLFVLFTVHLIERTGADPAAIHFVPLETRPHHKLRFISVASSSPDDLRQHPEPVQMSAKYLAACRAAWDAITDDTPAALAAFAGNGTATVRRILSNLLNRYPKVETGLSLWDSMLLARTGQNGPEAVRVIAEVLCDTWENGDSACDRYLYYRLKQMASAENPAPLLLLRGAPDTYRGAEVALTEFGRAVLDGQASAYPTNPIDEWIGGVHVSSATGNIWMSDGDSVRKMPAN